MKRHNRDNVIAFDAQRISADYLDRNANQARALRTAYLSDWIDTTARRIARYGREIRAERRTDHDRFAQMGFGHKPRTLG